MSPRTTYGGFGGVSFLVDPTSAERNAGQQIDWDEVDADDFADPNGGVGKFIPHGHPMAPSEGTDTNKVVPATNAAGNEADAIGLLEGPAYELDQTAALSGYGLVTGGLVYAELVPGLTATTQGALEDLPRGFRFETYADSRASES